MVNSKDKGARWEREAAELLNRLIDGANFKKIPGSGAIGTILSDSRLVGDLAGNFPKLANKIKVECKSGYGDKQMTLKKDWLDKIKSQAESDFSFPLLLGRFDNARSGVRYFVVMDLDSFAKLINFYSSKIEE